MSVANLIRPQGAIAGSWVNSTGAEPTKSQRAPIRMIDGSGVIFVGAPGEEGDYTKYRYLPSLDEYGINTAWTGMKPTGGTINDIWAIVDLGQIHTIDTISLFSYNPKQGGVNTDRATKALDIWVREDGGFSNSNLDGAAFNTNGWTLLTVSGDMILDRYPGGTTQSVAGVLSSLESVKGRYVALDINSNYGHSSFSLIGEVQVFGSVYVPDSDLLKVSRIYANYEVSATRRAKRLVDGSGLIYNGVSGQEGDYKKYFYGPAVGPGAEYGEYFNWSGLVTHPTTIDDMWVIADLGAVCDVNALSIFNFNPSQNIAIDRSVKKLDIWIREDADLNNTEKNGLAFNTNGWTLVTIDAEMTLKQNPGGTTQTVHNVLAMQGNKARMVALDINSNYGPWNIAGLGEIQLFGKLELTNTVNVIPSTVIAYSEFADGREAVNTINGSGLDFTGAIGEEGDYSKYHYLPDNEGAFAFNSDWSGRTATNQAGDDVYGLIDDMWLIYDLGQERDIRAVSIFNFNPAQPNHTRSVKSLNIWVRSDAGFSNTNLDKTAFDATGWTLMTAAAAMNLAKNPGGTTQTVHNVMAFGDVTGRYVALDINENYGDPIIVALGEVQFFCDPLPPIPQGTVILVR
ncbi:MAG: hypothetical protein PHO37_08640 [Kiritimatiellae bacterium]|nr:hypothetical protein [Kiritimatiellia bacterium]